MAKIISGEDLQELKATLLTQLGDTDPSNCIFCKEPFSNLNVFSPAGWRETKISHTCEKCFDEMWGD